MIYFFVGTDRFLATVKDKKTYEATIQILEDTKAKIETLKMQIARLHLRQNSQTSNGDDGNEKKTFFYLITFIITKLY